MKLLSYQLIDKQRIELQFEDNQRATLYSFGKDFISDTSDWVTKHSLAEIKKKLLKDGIEADLSEFVNREFKKYWEE